MTLFLDDDKMRMNEMREKYPDLYVWVEHAADAIGHLASPLVKWDYVLLDHDLDGRAFVSEDEINTGSEVVRWMARYFPDKTVRVVLHTHNEGAARSMLRTFTAYGFFNVVVSKFWTTDLGKIPELFSNTKSTQASAE